MTAFKYLALSGLICGLLAPRPSRHRFLKLDLGCLVVVVTSLRQCSHQ